MPEHGGLISLLIPTVQFPAGFVLFPVLSRTGIELPLAQSANRVSGSTGPILVEPTSSSTTVERAHGLDP